MGDMENTWKIQDEEALERRIKIERSWENEDRLWNLVMVLIFGTLAVGSVLAVCHLCGLPWLRYIESAL